jgi:hypothetical protein
MKKFIVETATQTVLNVIMVDPNNIPVLPSGQEYRDEAGNKGQHWNGTEWVYPTERLERMERDRRDNKLVKYVDPIATNTLKWNALSPTEQAAWATYRQALLDVPQQTGFPQTVVWPTKVGE